MPTGLKINVRIEGVRETLRAFRELPPEASKELRDRTQTLSEDLAVKIRAAGNNDSRQSARAAKSVKARRDRVPVITAGGTKRSSAVLFGSEFGMTRRSGWYAAGRYGHSPARQFRPHRGANSYWFFRTVEQNQAEIGRAWTEVADSIIRKWAV